MKKYIDQCFIILIFVIVSCSKIEEGINMFNIFGEKDNITLFWKWFNKNHNELYNFNESNSEQKLDMILGELTKIEPGLSIEISNEQNGIRQLIISPNGVKEKFNIVTKIVMDAPPFENWEIIAFKQRAKEKFTLKYQDLIIDPSEMYFIPIRNDKSLDIIIYGKNFNKYDINTVGNYTLIMLDNLIGEYDCVMKVRYFDFKDITEEKNKSELRKLTELPEYIDNISDLK